MIEIVPSSTVSKHCGEGPRGVGTMSQLSPNFFLKASLTNLSRCVSLIFAQVPVTCILQVLAPSLYKTDTANLHLAMSSLFSGLAWLSCLLPLSDVGAASLDWAGNRV